MNGVHCGIALIYGSSTYGLASAPAIAPSAYRSLELQSQVAQITQQFGAPVSKRDLKTFLGVASLTALMQSQPAGETCAYYLNASDRTGRAYQLCFDGGHALVEKAILTTSPPTASLLSQ